VSRKKEAGIRGNSDLLPSFRNADGIIPRIIKLLKEAGRATRLDVRIKRRLARRTTDGVRCLGIAAAFDKFGKTLMPILQQIGIDSRPPTVLPVDKVTVSTPKVTSHRKQAKSSDRGQRR